mmetsp:Transcript_24808/g.54093  ORF Transcript_24808/g.54093 Transcript_24808/m.54093 type:complete len:102 (-) Transcript_24808:141-446(-)
MPCTAPPHDLITSCTSPACSGSDGPYCHFPTMVSEKVSKRGGGQLEKADASEAELMQDTCTGRITCTLSRLISRASTTRRPRGRIAFDSTRSCSLSREIEE